MRQDFGLDAIDVMVLDEVLRLKKSGGEVTIMEIVDRSSVASPATVHARIKSLCEKDILVKVEHKSNMRYKMLEKGPRYLELTKALAGV
jgi:predicted transcriptional regulator